MDIDVVTQVFEMAIQTIVIVGVVTVLLIITMRGG